MLLKKLIFFESIDKCKNEDPELKYNMYNLFFGMKQQGKDEKKETDSQKDGDNTVDHDKEEKMKKLALRLEA